MPEAEKDAAHQKFQSIAFAYAILSDPGRRSRYDTTGRTSESLDDGEEGEFNWSDFYKAQFKEVITADAIAKFKEEYRGSEEEKLAVIGAYVEYEGDMDRIFEEVMLSEPLEDEERFRVIIDEQIEEKVVEAFDKYVKETKGSKKRRRDNAKKEAKEAEEAARELGVHEELFGNATTGGAENKEKAKKGGKKKKEDDTSGLAALIRQRQATREGDFFANLEAKYAPKKGKRRAEEEPPEEAFQKTAERAKKSRTKEPDALESTSPRKSKRAKR